MAYMGTAARVNWMMARCGLLPAAFTKINRAGVPSLALVATVLIGLLLLQGGASWSKAVGFITSALVISLAMGPVSLIALREQAPQVLRPYKLPAAEYLCPLAFVLATWAIFWCGWDSLQVALPLILAPACIYLLAKRRNEVEIKSAIWWFVYLIGIGCASYLFGADRLFPLSEAWQLFVLAAFGLSVFPWAVRTRLDQPSPHAMVQLGS